MILSRTQKTYQTLKVMKCTDLRKKSGNFKLDSISKRFGRWQQKAGKVFFTTSYVNRQQVTNMTTYKKRGCVFSALLQV